MDFPHINDTQFPNLNNVDVYKYKNNFDYARWQGKATYKLLNVRWNSTYNDVPYFNTIEERDEWFDSQESKVGVLESVFNNTPKQKLKVPLPFNDMYHYNYIIIDMPIQTSEEQPINYGDEELRVKRWFYFIEDMTQFAPSTTELEISIDYWTTFIHSVSIPYLMLERGHAPMFKTTVESYLQNPILNNEYLLADDFNYSNETIIKTSTYYPIGNETKYVLFCAPYSQSDFAYFGGSTYSGNATPPTFSDIDNRWGYQLRVNGYEWKYGNADYSNANLPITNEVQNGIFNGCKCYAIAAEYAMDFFNECEEHCVNFLHGIQAMFILSGDLFDIESEFSFRNYTIYSVQQKTNSRQIRLSKDAFGFPDKYSKITKLYTFPYSQLEVTDDEGNSFTAKIENTGRIEMQTEVSLVYPFLNYNILFSGINGYGKLFYEWKNVNGTIEDENIWADDFSKYMMNWKIPVYSLYVSAEHEYAANNYFDNAAKRAAAIKDYENAVRYANTTRANIADSYATNTTNVSATGSTNVTNTAADGDTLVTNTDNLTDAMVANMAADMKTLLDNTDIACKKATTLQTSWRSVKQEDIKNANNQKITDDASVAAHLTMATTSANNAMAAIAYGNSSSASLNGAAANMAGSMGSGFFAGGGTGAVSGGISGVVGMAQTGFSIQAAGANLIASVATEQTIATKTADATNAYAQHAKDCNNAVLQATQILDAKTIQLNNECVTDQNINTARTNNADAGRSKTAQDTNAVNTRDTNNANADRTRDVNNDNAGRTQTTETNNATYTRNATVAAEKANLIQKQLNVANQYKNSRLHAPHKQGEYSGDFYPDAYHRRGVRFNIRTQSQSAIAQTGDAMLRFGYALHKVWDMSSGFHYGKQFTFWKAEDIWINDGSGVANIATNAIANILLSGVTVWRDASKIGTVGIYDNI